MLRSYLRSLPLLPEDLLLEPLDPSEKSPKKS
jgi:hypothetical protein